MLGKTGNGRLVFQAPRARRKVPAQVTVSYGDRYPVTPTGRAVAAVLMVTGVALIGTVTAAVAAWFVNAVRQASTAEGEADAATERADIQRQLVELQASVDALHQRLDSNNPPLAGKGGTPWELRPGARGRHTGVPSAERSGAAEAPRS